MIFDNLLNKIEEIFISYNGIIDLNKYKNKFFINRDLFGRISIVWDEEHLNQNDQLKNALENICATIEATLGKHTYPKQRIILKRAAPFQAEKEGAVIFEHGSQVRFTVIDRVLTESSWYHRDTNFSISNKIVVFYSIKGGVGRSTALAAAAWNFAQKGKSVMVVDMDLESPGISSSLLPEDRCPTYGLLDWLVEDLVDNGTELLDSMFALSPLAQNIHGNIFVIPAHGKEYGEYISKMGRAWMPQLQNGSRIPWPHRLRRVLLELDSRLHPDIILIDARSGLDEISSACVLGLAPKSVLLFALENMQTWAGYSMLFKYWNTVEVAKKIRESLQVVAAMVLDGENKESYVKKLRESSWNCFVDHLYDSIPAEIDLAGDFFTFDLSADEAPHSPWEIKWHQGISSLRQLYTLSESFDPAMVKAIFPFVDNLYENFFGDE